MTATSRVSLKNITRSTENKHFITLRLRAFSVHEKQGEYEQYSLIDAIKLVTQSLQTMVDFQNLVRSYMKESPKSLL